MEIKLYQESVLSNLPSQESKESMQRLFQVEGKFDLIPFLGSFSPKHPLLRYFATTGEDIEDIYMVDSLLNHLRRAWHPTSGCGSQTGIESESIVDWYRMIADDARNSFLESQ